MKYKLSCFASRTKSEMEIKALCLTVQALGNRELHESECQTEGLKVGKEQGWQEHGFRVEELFAIERQRPRTSSYSMVWSGVFYPLLSRKHDCLYSVLHRWAYIFRLGILSESGSHIQNRSHLLKRIVLWGSSKNLIVCWCFSLWFRGFRKLHDTPSFSCITSKCFPFSEARKR